MSLVVFAAAEINPGGLWDRILAFFSDFEAMFPGFRDVISQARIPFYSIAFVILVYRLVKTLSSPAADAGGNLQAIAQAMAFTALVAFCVPVVQTLRTAFDSLAAQVGYDGSPRTLEEKKEEVLTLLNHGVIDREKGEEEEQHGSLYYIFHPGEAVSDGADGVVNAFYGAAVQLVMFVCTLLFKLASLIMWAFWLAQQFLLLFNSIFLPAFVAMLAVGGLSGLGSRYVMGLVGLLAWPLGWAFINVGTAAMLESVGATLLSSHGWEIGAYLWAVAICMILPCWIIIGYAVAPFVIQRMVTTGGNAAQGMFSAMARASTNAATMVTGPPLSPRSSVVGSTRNDTEGGGDGADHGGQGRTPAGGTSPPSTGMGGGDSLAGSYQTAASPRPGSQSGAASAKHAAESGANPPQILDAAGGDVSDRLTNSSRRARTALSSRSGRPSERKT